ncbi:Na+/H+ antiporter NhaA [Catellatospora bangladeshensis]|uniref:Na(+)/H(+) antiporter NhaA n=1 Tax=Catellatospora bangladeshensis TaxID=310355 RepID=A0A8J3JR64_9ACTN|nr:Na+/H+ antiporter NhaA [Catellatospora bangladeshensis]GIF85441.1 Na(+)/H(+) antiporter NhaA [Catellatospora bangladeshensis]
MVSRPNTASLPPRPGPSPRVSIPVPHVSFPLQRFLATEAGGGLLLLIATVLALIWANIPGGGYEEFWHTEASVRVGDLAIDLDLRHWVNDLAMALFFLTVGLEISREVTVGELRRPRTVVVPVLGAIGGLVLPALIYVAFNPSPPALHGWGVPISTDTAFLVGVLALFGPRCPDQLRLFLLTLAIADDIGAILVLAVFYTDSVSVPALLAAFVLTLALVALRWARVWQLQPYVVVGMLLWVAVFVSGVHATLAGVVVGLLVPATPVEPEQVERLRYFGRAVIERADAVRARLAAAAARATVPPNDRLQDALHPVSAFLVIPVFGLANAGVRLDAETVSRAMTSPVTIGIVVALVVGKSVGISIGAAIGLRTGWGELPGRVRYGHLLGGALLAGIGFTISLFIADLAFDDPLLQAEAKIGVLAGSLLAAVLGSLALRCLGERLPLCTVDDDEAMPELPTGPWRDPTLSER